MCDNCPWIDILADIEEMLEDKTYAFASDTLEGIHGWVEEKGHVTERQETAVGNIRRGGR